MNAGCNSADGWHKFGHWGAGVVCITCGRLWQEASHGCDWCGTGEALNENMNEEWAFCPFCGGRLPFCEVSPLTQRIRDRQKGAEDMTPESVARGLADGSMFVAQLCGKRNICPMCGAFEHDPHRPECPASAPSKGAA